MSLDLPSNSDDALRKHPPPTILVVDDSPSVIALVDEILRPAYRIRVAVSGKQALAVLERDADVDLILLDVLMPDIDGFETCRRIKEMIDLHDVPVIFLTALNESDDEARGLSLGAVDYITKPVAPPILRARVSTHLELRRVRRELQDKNDILNAEREIIEAMIIRMRADPDIDAHHLRCLMRPVERTSGDLYLAAFCPDGRQMILVGDFTGHGLTAAIAGPGVKQAFYALCSAGATLPRLAERLNELLCVQLLVTQFMAGHLVEVDAARRQVTLWSGGMPEPLHADANGVVRPVPVSGLPLGILAEQDIGSATKILPLQPNERLLLYSDGIIEANDGSETMYGLERLGASYAAILQNGDPLASLLVDLDRFIGNTPQNDDILLVELNVSENCDEG